MIYFLQKFVLELIFVLKICFILCTILSNLCPIFFKLCIRVDIGEKWFGIKDG